ncbi:uncharacterized protein LOC135696010 [Rhopilema esculentum]|uniref:uncharacterized protein LOC135696010 n=1 Tax=Rhopilema esculentum TaxID=499914 RepID=UPI0031DA3AE6|eukprot:gene12019-2604_t
MAQLRISLLSFALFACSFQAFEARHLADRENMKATLDEAKILLEDALRGKSSGERIDNNGAPARGHAKPSADQLASLLDAAVKELEDEYEAGHLEANRFYNENADQAAAKEHSISSGRSKLHSGSTNKKGTSRKNGAIKQGVLLPSYANMVHNDGSNEQGPYSADELLLLGSRRVGGKESHEQHARLPYYEKIRQYADGTTVGQSDGPYSAKFLKAIKGLFHDVDATGLHEGIQGQGVRLAGHGSTKSKSKASDEMNNGWNLGSLKPYFSDVYEDLQHDARIEPSDSGRSSALPLDETEYDDLNGRGKLEEPPYGWFQKSVKYQHKDDLDNTRLADELENLAAALEDEISGKHPKVSNSVRHDKNKFPNLNKLQKSSKHEGQRVGQGPSTNAAKQQEIKASMQETDVVRNDLHRQPEIDSKSVPAAAFEGRPRSSEDGAPLGKEEAQPDDRNRESRMIDELEARVAELQQDIAAKERQNRNFKVNKGLRM